MTSISLDLSTKLEPQVVRLLRSAASVAAKLDVEFIVAGAYVYAVLAKTENFQSAFRLFNVLNAGGLALSNAQAAVGSSR